METWCINRIDKLKRERMEMENGRPNTSSLTYSVLTVTSLVQGTYGINHMAFSLPSVVNRQGISNRLELPLAADERIALENSSLILQSAIESLNYVFA